MARRALLIVFLLVPLVNFGSFLLPGGDRQFSDMTETRVDAAGYAFSIWAVIFAGMIAFSIHVNRTNDTSRSLRTAVWCLIIAGVASILFVPVSLYANQVVGWLDILLHLIPLGIALACLRRHCIENPSGTAGRWTYVGPSMYCGWITAAFVISTALMLREIGIEVPGVWATATACTVLGLITMIGCLMIFSRDAVYGATIVWALIAIGVEQGAYPSIRYTAWAGAAIALACLPLSLLVGHTFYAVDTSLRARRTRHAHGPASATESQG